MGAASTVTGPTGPVGSGGAVGAASTVTGPAGVLSTTFTPNTSVDTAHNIKTSLVSSVLNVDYTNLYTKLSSYALTSALSSYLTTASAASTYHALPRIQAYCSATGTITNSQGTTTITGKSTGTYPLTFSGSATGFPIVQCLTASASVSYNANIISWAGSSCTVVVKDHTNTLVDASFWIVIFV